MAKIKEEEDLNPNDAKYANKPLDLAHLASILKAKENTAAVNLDLVEDF